MSKRVPILRLIRLELRLIYWLESMVLYRELLHMMIIIVRDMRLLVGPLLKCIVRVEVAALSMETTTSITLADRRKQKKSKSKPRNRAQKYHDHHYV